MVIECSSCHARFKLADEKIKESGTKVRCTKCREVFTVFPEKPSTIAPPIVTAPTVPPQPNSAVEDALFPGVDTAPFVAEIPPPAVDASVRKEADRNQDVADRYFPDTLTDEAGASDLDAISFDNIEAPVFSVASEKESKFELADEKAFSFTESSFASETKQPYKITEAPDVQSFSGESDNDFEANYSTTVPSTIPPTEDLNQFKPVATDGDFTFSDGDNLADFSWDEPETPPIVTTAPEKPVNTGGTPQDTAFDFSSFSFDEVDAPVGFDENKSEEKIAQSEAKIELSMGTETAPAPIRPMLPPIEAEPPSAPLGRERQVSTPRPVRPLHPRARQKKKGSSRLAVKVITFILLALAATYGIKNRDLIQKTYTNIVNRVIENQTRVETSGQIGLVNLSGSYVLNSQEGELFVIRGEAINEFKELRSSVLVKGTIFGDNGEVLQTQSAYCGNPLKDSRLKKLGFKEIRDVMSNELGENLVNLNIATGKGIPFTIVFNKVPKTIKEFTVEVLESKPGSK